jgi:hypothetical protein
MDARITHITALCVLNAVMDPTPTRVGIGTGRSGSVIATVRVP